jgi:hypothetical protein
VFANWIATLIPFGVDSYPGSLGWVLALLALTVLLASGWRIGFHDAQEGRRARCLLAVACLFPLCGALVYGPWRFYEARYAYPYLVGTAILLGMATTYLERWPAAIGRQTARVASIIVGVFAATGAWAAAGKADALQRAVDAVIETVHTANRADSVFVTAPPRPLGLEWTGVGPSMSRLARATDRPWPPVREIRCEDVRAPAVNVVVVTLQSFCVGLPFSTHVAHQFPVLNWAQWSLDHDSVYFDLQLRDEREPTAH